VTYSCPRPDRGREDDQVLAILHALEVEA